MFNVISVVKNGYSLRVMQDESPESPREWHNNLGVLVASHRRYSLGDEEAANTGLYGSWEEWAANEIPEDAVKLPVYMLDHGLITISTTPFTCSWDSGQLGWIYATRERIESEGLAGRTDDEIKDILRAEIDTYDMYLRGYVYGFVYEKITGCECCGTEQVEFIDSCFGFYADNMSDLLTSITDYGLPEELIEAARAEASLV